MDKITAAGAIRSLANKYAAMNEAADILEQLGSLDNATAEAIRDKEAAIADKKAALIELEKAQGALKQSKDQAKAILEKSVVDANEWVAGAKSESEAIVKEAKAQAQDILSKASNDNLVALSMVKSNIDSASDKLSKINEELEAKKAELANLDELIAQSQEKHLAAKAAIAKILG